jgi:hypothetical protein
MTPTMDPARLGRLTAAQRTAWQHIEETVLRRRAKARSQLSTVLSSVGCSETLFDEAAECIRRHARVVVHFHPDQIGTQPVTVVELLLEGAEYRSQFETGLSSGSLTAFPGGARDTWEETLFGGAYHGLGGSLSDRPKYGALELIRYPDGPWPRFGSCYFVLR